MRIFLACMIFINSFFVAASGVSFEEAVGQATKHFANSGKLSHNKQVVISEIKNYHSQKKDQLSKQLETELYFAFDKQFPRVKLIDESESIVGVSFSNTIFIKGSYNQTGSIASLQLKSVKGILTGEIIDQVSVESETKYDRKTLVAVLDIESNILKSDQRRIFSDIFREALNDLDVFEMASSSDVDKMNPDDIQKATGCTKDTCATVIGEQSNTTGKTSGLIL